MLKAWWPEIILPILYGVGLLSAAINIHEDFFLLTPFLMLLTLGCILYRDTMPIRLLLPAGLLVALGGFFIEVAGVQTGNVFGVYTYGAALGPHLFDVPVLMAVQWFLVVYGGICLIQSIRAELPIIAVAFINGILTVLLDLVIEPVAITRDFWTWEAVTVPIQNYIAWFVCSFIFTLVMLLFTRDYHNRVAALVFVLLFIFFGSLTALL